MQTTFPKKQLFNEKQAMIASYVIMIVGLILLIPLHLLPCFIAGFLVYEMINALTPYFEKFINGRRARIADHGARGVSDR